MHAYNDFSVAKYLPNWKVCTTSTTIVSGVAILESNYFTFGHPVVQNMESAKEFISSVKYGRVLNISE